MLLLRQDYLAGELQSEVRHEYIDGQVYAMAGAHKDHNRVAGEVFRIIANHLQNKPCQPYASDMKVKVGKNFFYPDVMVDCSGQEQDYYTQYPTLLLKYYLNPHANTTKPLNVKPIFKFHHYKNIF
jgi:Uma2 family endonuclease